jgi:hypothetical protein
MYLVEEQWYAEAMAPCDARGPQSWERYEADPVAVHEAANPPETTQATAEGGDSESDSDPPFWAEAEAAALRVGSDPSELVRLGRGHTEEDEKRELEQEEELGAGNVTTAVVQEEEEER